MPEWYHSHTMSKHAACEAKVNKRKIYRRTLISKGPSTRRLKCPKASWIWGYNFFAEYWNPKFHHHNQFNSTDMTTNIFLTFIWIPSMLWGKRWRSWLRHYKSEGRGFNSRWCHWNFGRLCGLVVRVSGYRYRGLGFDSRHYQIFWVVVGLERGPLSLVRSIVELLE